MPAQEPFGTEHRDLHCPLHENSAPFFILLAPGCAILGSESYFAADSKKGMPEWTGDPRISHITGKPDTMRYTHDEIEFTVYTAPLASMTYSFGPCVPLPLPIIPFFGLDHSEQKGPVQIRFSVFHSQKQHKLVRATVLAGDKALAPKAIQVSPHPPGAGDAPSPEAFLPLPLIEKSTYVLTYDIPSSSTEAYELVFYIQDESAASFLKDVITFMRASSLTFTCVP